MSTKLIYKTSTTGGEETKSLALKVGQQIKGGEIFVLHGDLGFGKTAFIKGLVAGAGINDEVTSPSFTISNVYSGKGIVFHHMDFYRINEPGILKDELLEIIKDNKNVLAIEWADAVQDVLPEDCIDINIKNEGGDKRFFEIKYPSDKKYLVERIGN